MRTFTAFIILPAETTTPQRTLGGGPGIFPGSSLFGSGDGIVWMESGVRRHVWVSWVLVLGYQIQLRYGIVGECQGFWLSHSTETGGSQVVRIITVFAGDSLRFLIRMAQACS